MIAGWVLLLVSIAYVGLLFAVAWIGDRRPLYPRHAWLRPLVYSLALAVYCSSWTFYGAVGTAASTGWGFLPIYLGPILLFVFAWRVLERMVLIGHEQNTVSIADFIGARFGRDQGLAALVSVIAVIAVIPYLALQLKAVAMSIDVLTGTPIELDGAARSVPADPALYVATLLALFAILFGTRRIDATEHHHGMMLAVALESLVKLVAFIMLGVYAFGLLPGAEGIAGRMAVTLGEFAERELPRGFVAQTLLAFTAILCLPRQFQVAVVECEEVGDVRRARWLFTGYLLLICLMVLPITSAGIATLGGNALAADAYVLALPLSQGNGALALAAYVGGFSAATGMVIVASVALATMISNDLIMPALWRAGLLRADRHNPLGALLLWVRRLSIVALIAAAYAYYRTAGGTGNLAAFGLLAFAAVAQFAPALFGGLYWRGASRQGVYAGLGAGFGIWVYTLLLPTLTRAGWLTPDWLQAGPFGLAWLRPEQLFGLSGWDAITHGTFWSLLLNVGALLVVSARYRPSFEDRIRATPFLDPYASRPIADDGWRGNVRVADLLALAGRVVGERQARRSFTEFLTAQGRELHEDAQADRALVQFCERLLAASIGAASARMTLTTALRGTGMELGEVVHLLDEASQELRFNREVLSTTLENISQAVSVVDRDLRLVAWNRRYQTLFDFPDGALHVGRPVADLIRYNAERGEMGEGDIDAMVEKRVEHLRQGHPHVFERVRPNGQVIEVRGQPLAGGGYVTGYSDVTEYKRVERALREANESLEARVAQRTRELAEAVRAQRQARQDAVAANESKTRFLTALSHDVLQPLNAARLFAAALREADDPAEHKRLAERVDTSLRAAEELLDGLLDISRLDAGALKPELADFLLDDLLSGIAEQYLPLADARGLRFRQHRTGVVVRSDRRLLRRVVQNLVANALRYTREGRVVLGGRRRGEFLEIEVWDTGAGIPEHHLRQIFEEFKRLDGPSPWGEQGLGLGLSICQRISRMLDHPMRVRSWPGRGSVFAIRVPLGRCPAEPVPPVSSIATAHDLAGLRVLCLDNDREILAGMAALLDRWGVRSEHAETLDAALAIVADEPPQVLLVDYHLHDRADGLDALDRLRALCGDRCIGALVTADGSDGLKRRARKRGYPVLTKPIKPASLRAFLAAGRGSPRR